MGEGGGGKIGAEETNPSVKEVEPLSVQGSFSKLCGSVGSAWIPSAR